MFIDFRYRIVMTPSGENGDKLSLSRPGAKSGQKKVEITLFQEPQEGAIPLKFSDRTVYVIDLEQKVASLFSGEDRPVVASHLSSLMQDSSGQLQDIAQLIEGFNQKILQDEGVLRVKAFWQAAQGGKHRSLYYRIMNTFAQGELHPERTEIESLHPTFSISHSKAFGKMSKKRHQEEAQMVLELHQFKRPLMEPGYAEKDPFSPVFAPKKLEATAAISSPSGAVVRREFTIDKDTYDKVLTTLAVIVQEHDAWQRLLGPQDVSLMFRLRWYDEPLPPTIWLVSVPVGGESRQFRLFVPTEEHEKGKLRFPPNKFVIQKFQVKKIIEARKNPFDEIINALAEHGLLTISGAALLNDLRQLKEMATDHEARALLEDKTTRYSFSHEAPLRASELAERLDQGLVNGDVFVNGMTLDAHMKAWTPLGRALYIGPLMGEEFVLARVPSPDGKLQYDFEPREQVREGIEEVGFEVDPDAYKKVLSYLEDHQLTEEALTSSAKEFLEVLKVVKGLPDDPETFAILRDNPESFTVTPVTPLSLAQLAHHFAQEELAESLYIDGVTLAEHTGDSSTPFGRALQFQARLDTLPQKVKLLQFSTPGAPPRMTFDLPGSALVDLPVSFEAGAKRHLTLQPLIENLRVLGEHVTERSKKDVAEFFSRLDEGGEFGLIECLMYGFYDLHEGNIGFTPGEGHKVNRLHLFDLDFVFPGSNVSHRVNGKPTLPVRSAILGQNWVFSPLKEGTCVRLLTFVEEVLPKEIEWLKGEDRPLVQKLKSSPEAKELFFIRDALLQFEGFQRNNQAFGKGPVAQLAFTFTYSLAGQDWSEDCVIPGEPCRGSLAEIVADKLGPGWEMETLLTGEAGYEKRQQIARQLFPRMELDRIEAYQGRVEAMAAYLKAYNQLKQVVEHSTQEEAIQDMIAFIRGKSCPLATVEKVDLLGRLKKPDVNLQEELKAMAPSYFNIASVMFPLLGDYYALLAELQKSFQVVPKKWSNVDQVKERYPLPPGYYIGNWKLEFDQLERDAGLILFFLKTDRIDSSVLVRKLEAFKTRATKLGFFEP